jgi:hypothetical protein
MASSRQWHLLGISHAKVCQTTGHPDSNRSIQRYSSTNEHTSHPYHGCNFAISFPQPFHTFAGTEHVTSISGRESGGFQVVCGSFNVISPKQAVPTGVCPPLLSQMPGCFSFCLSYYASKGPLLVTRSSICPRRRLEYAGRFTTGRSRANHRHWRVGNLPVDGTTVAQRSQHSV